MKAFLICIALLIASANAARPSLGNHATAKHNAAPSFADWMSVHGKVYGSPQEHSSAQAAYEANLARIHAHNANPARTFQMEVGLTFRTGLIA